MTNGKLNDDNDDDVPHPLADSRCKSCDGTGYIFFQNTCDCVDAVAKFRCPDFETTSETIKNEYDGFEPSCAGKWIKGSGGHRVHDFSSGCCDKKATWWHPDDSFAYCDTHCPDRDKIWYKRLWENTVNER